MNRFLLKISDLFKRSSGPQEARIPIHVSGGSFVYTPGGEAMNVATFYRCVSLLSESVAGLELQYLWKNNGRYEVADNSPYPYLLSVQPQAQRSAFTFWMTAVQHMLIKGNAYIYPKRTLGEVTDFILCSPEYVTHDAINALYRINDPVNGVIDTLGERDIIHLFIHTADGLRGISVLEHARMTMDTALAGDAETRNRFTNGGNVRGLITNDRSDSGRLGEYQDSELSKTAVDVDTRFRSGEHIVSLPGQVDFKQISLSSTDMQFLESRKFTVREICRFFGVHPSYVFDDTSNNYKSAEMAAVAFLSNTLDPILKRIECEFNRKLIPMERFNKYCFRYDRRGVYSMDLISKADYQRKTIESGIYTINDWRRLENLSSVEGGDVVYISTNLAPLGSSKITGDNNNKDDGK